MESVDTDEDDTRLLASPAPLPELVFRSAKGRTGTGAAVSSIVGLSDFWPTVAARLRAARIAGLDVCELGAGEERAFGEGLASRPPPVKPLDGGLPLSGMSGARPEGIEGAGDCIVDVFCDCVSACQWVCD